MNKYLILFIVPSICLATPPPSGMPSPMRQFFDPRAVKNSFNLWVEAQALIWKASEDGLGYATKSQSQTSVRGGHIESPDFQWDAGVRVGLGMKLPYDHWDLLFQYAYVPAKAHSSVRAPNGGAVFSHWEVPNNLPANFFAEHARLRWEAELNIADIMLSRNCFPGRGMSIRPFLGVRGLVIDQDIHVDYEGGTAVPVGDTDELRYENDFWGVGLRMGFDSLWGLGGGWGIYGSGAASLLSGNFHIMEKEKFKNAHLERLQLKSEPNSLVAVAELVLGIRWDRLFSQDRYNFGMRFGWEFNIFFDQNRLVHFIIPNNPGAITQSSEDLSFQGLTIGFRLDF